MPSSRWGPIVAFEEGAEGAQGHIHAYSPSPATGCPATLWALPAPRLLWSLCAGLTPRTPPSQSWLCLPTQSTGLQTQTCTTIRRAWVALTLHTCSAMDLPPDRLPWVQVFSPSPDRLRVRLASVRERPGPPSAGGGASQLSLRERGLSELLCMLSVGHPRLGEAGGGPPRSGRGSVSPEIRGFGLSWKGRGGNSWVHLPTLQTCKNPSFAQIDSIWGN